MPRRRRNRSIKPKASNPPPSTMQTNFIPQFAKEESEDSQSDHKDYINIMMMGETGVGKSTFMNSLANYLIHGSFENAEKSTLELLMSVKFSAGGQDYTVGEDDNEEEETGASATQKVKSYVFEAADARIRLIDTPGLADTRGVYQDEKNCEYILDYLSKLEEVHAICFVMKPTVTRLTPQFNYCMKQLLMRLQKSACENIIFVITNTRGTSFEGGDTLPCLNQFLKELKKVSENADIPLGRESNVFCVDSDGFKYLMAKECGHELEGDKETYIKSWTVSLKECRRMMAYIMGNREKLPLLPHRIEDTTTVNKARRLMVILSKPLAEIKQIITDSSDILKEFQAKIATLTKNLDDSKKNLLSITCTNVKKIKQKQPLLVCTSQTCRGNPAQILNVKNEKKYHYAQLCHQPCTCDMTGIEKDKIGHRDLTKCGIIQGENCTICGCHFSCHIYIDYLTETFEDKLPDPNVQKEIDRYSKDLEGVKRDLKNTTMCKEEHSKEQKCIIEFTQECVAYLRNNAIIPYDDSFKNYISHLIQCKKGRGLNNCDGSSVEDLEDLLSRYEETKEAFENTPKNKIASSPEMLEKSVGKLFGLRNFGNKIKEMFEGLKGEASEDVGEIDDDYVYPETVFNVTGDEELLIFVNY